MRRILIYSAQENPRQTLAGEIRALDIPVSLVGEERYTLCNTDWLIKKNDLYGESAGV